MSKIKIVGSSQLHDFEEVKDSVIPLSGEYFWKHDRENLVKVKLPDGKHRLYRKKSPLLVETVDGDFARKADCIKTEDGIWFARHSPNLVTVDGKPTHVNFTVKIKEKYYLKSDERLVKIKTGRKIDYELRSNVLKLDPEVYGEEYVRDSPEIVKIDNQYYRQGDCLEYMDVVKGEAVFSWLTPNKPRKPLREVFRSFKDITNPQIGRYDLVYTDRDDAIADTELGMYFHKEFYKAQKTAIEDLTRRTIDATIAEAKKKFDANYDDADEKENNPKHWSTEFQVWGGKQHLFGHIGDPIISSTFKKLGGMRYCFGKETETSGGRVPATKADKLGIEAVGDRSIGAAEYVTGILHGDNGLAHMEKAMNLIHDHCMVDKRCGEHFHIGQLKDENTLRFPELKFDKSFAIGAIRLGCQIEEDLYKILPPSRSPYNYHCSSILRYKDIDEDNWRDYLGCYLFGPREDAIRKRGAVDMTQYSYGSPGHDKSSELSNWCGGRYKWLNLVRAYTRCSSPTIEFRIFSGTTCFEKAYNYLLICMSFVHTVQNNYREIMNDGYSLRSMLHNSYSKHPDILEQVINFITEREQKFKGRKIY